MFRNKIKWELVNSTAQGPFAQGPFQLPTFYTYRVDAPGGWLVKFEFFKGRQDSTHALTYMPDPDHLWEVDKEITWDLLYDSQGPNWVKKTFRYQVPQGWLITDIYAAENHFNCALVFLPGGEWDPEKEVS